VIDGVLVLLFGGLAAIARFAVDSLVTSRRDGAFPRGTLIVNAGGTFLLGLLVGLDASHRTMLLVGTATLGSYTTFSTWMLETHRPAEDGERRLAWQNIAVGLTVGFAALALGRAVGRGL
jgi:fluoride exporter